MRSGKVARIDIFYAWRGRLGSPDLRSGAAAPAEVEPLEERLLGVLAGQALE